jgi:hypothetical protein
MAKITHQSFVFAILTYNNKEMKIFLKMFFHDQYERM